MGLFAANPKPLTEAEPFLAVRFDRTRLQIGYQSEERTEAAQPTSNGDSLSRGAPVLHSAPPPIHSCSAQSTSAKTGACRMHAPLESSAAAARDTSPEVPLTAATASDQGFSATEATPQPPDLSTGQSQSALSLWRMCPAPPVSTPTDCDCLAATPPRPVHGHDHAQAQLLLRPHSQTSAFESPARPWSRHRRPSRLLKPFLR